MVVYSAECENCTKEIYILRWATKTAIRIGKNKGKEIKIPIWRHRVQVAPGALCGEGINMNLTATPPPGEEYKE